MIILRYHEIFLRLTAPEAKPGHLGAVSLKKSHDIIILPFCNIVKGQAICVLKLQQLSLNPNENQKSFLMTHLTDGPSDKGR